MQIKESKPAGSSCLSCGTIFRLLFVVLAGVVCWIYANEMKLQFETAAKESSFQMDLLTKERNHLQNATVSLNAQVDTLNKQVESLQKQVETETARHKSERDALTEQIKNGEERASEMNKHMSEVSQENESLKAELGTLKARLEAAKHAFNVTLVHEAQNPPKPQTPREETQTPAEDTQTPVEDTQAPPEAENAPETENPQ